MSANIVFKQFYRQAKARRHVLGEARNADRPQRTDLHKEHPHPLRGQSEHFGEAVCARRHSEQSHGHDDRPELAPSHQPGYDFYDLQGI